MRKIDKKGAGTGCGLKRCRYNLTGQVQGVGFRPFVYQLAQRFHLTGWVKNDETGVTIEVQGACLAEFEKALLTELPRQADIDTFQHQTCTPVFEEKDFQICASTDHNPRRAWLMPDTGICPTCRQELFDPSSRYYLYPFVNCADCGPRYSSITHLPYDRKYSSLQPFPLCTACENEYTDIQSRRFHIESIACAQCGPRYDTPFTHTAQTLKEGQIIAFKGLGGFHLIADAHNPQAVSSLRKRKNRPTKPFALMALNRASVEQFAYYHPLLDTPEKPITLLRQKPDANINGSIAPGLNRVGVMLPYTPAHYLLFYYLLGCPSDANWLEEANDILLICTSANRSGHPLITEADSPDLGLLADQIVDHNRKIIMPIDDTVVKPMDNKRASHLRRARGFAPTPLILKDHLPCVLALGSYLKNTFCYIRDNKAFISPYLGDLDSIEMETHQAKVLEHFQRIFQFEPRVLVHDHHPDALPLNLPSPLFDLPRMSIQHHHAHAGAVMAEHHLQGPCLALILDGFGYGEDGQAWGGELLLCDEHYHFKRLGHLSPLALPGQDLAAKEPWRCAVSLLHQLGLHDCIQRQYSDYPVNVVCQMLDHNINCPNTSSMGRWFDAIASLANLCQINHYEGEAACRLESRVTQPNTIADAWHITSNNQLNLLPLAEKLVGQNAIEIANAFHGTLISALCDWVVRNSRTVGVKQVVLAGGCFANEYLHQHLAQALTKEGITPYLPRQVPCNDESISLGQAFLAAQKIQLGA